MLSKPTPEALASATDLCKAVATGDLEKVRAELELSMVQIRDLINSDSEVLAEDKKAEMNEVFTAYVNRPVPSLGGQTALHLVGHLPMNKDFKDLMILQALLERRANPNAIAGNGSTLMSHYATTSIQVWNINESDKIAIVGNVHVRIEMLVAFKGDPYYNHRKGENVITIMEKLPVGWSERIKVVDKMVKDGTDPHSVISYLSTRKQWVEKEERMQAKERASERDDCCAIL